MIHRIVKYPPPSYICVAHFLLLLLVMSHTVLAFVYLLLNLVRGGHTTRLSICPPGQFGQDCSCISNYPSGTCVNGTWTISGGFLTAGNTWDIKNDRFYIQGNFRLFAGAFILI